MFGKHLVVDYRKEENLARMWMTSFRQLTFFFRRLFCWFFFTHDFLQFRLCLFVNETFFLLLLVPTQREKLIKSLYKQIERGVKLTFLATEINLIKFRNEKAFSVKLNYLGRLEGADAMSDRCMTSLEIISSNHNFLALSAHKMTS